MQPFGTGLTRGRYLLLTTYRRGGEPVPTPVWFVTDGPRLLVSTGPSTGKVRRIRANPSVLVAPCTLRGRPTGDAVPALTGSQVELLRVVETSPGVGIAAAARAMHLAGNSVSALVYQLVDAGYLRREIDPADRRAAQLHLTRAATARLAGWRTERARLVSAGLAGMSPAERQAIARALPALRRLAEILSTVDVSAAARSTVDSSAVDGSTVDTEVSGAAHG